MQGKNPKRIFAPIVIVLETFLEFPKKTYRATSKRETPAVGLFIKDSPKKSPTKNKSLKSFFSFSKNNNPNIVNKPTKPCCHNDCDNKE